MDPQRVTMLNRVALGVAAAVRFAGLLAVGRTPYVDAPLVDAYTYWDQAGKLLAGDAPFKEGFYQPPGYPVVLAAFGRLTGGLDFQTARAFNLLCGLVTTALLIHLGRRLGERSAAPWMGAVAGLIYTLYPTTLLFELDLLTPALSNVLLIGAVALLWTDDEPSTARAGGAGLLAGIACVVHPTYLIAAVALGLWLLVRGGASAGGLKRQAIALAVGLGLALAPTTLTNLSRFGHLTLVSHNSGVNFYLGNNPDWRETAFLRPGLLFRKLVLEAEPAERGPFERNAYWWDRSWAEIGEAPDAWLATLFTKSLWSVNNREIPRNEDYRCRTEKGPLAWVGDLPVRYGFVFPFAVLGGAVLLRQGGRDRLLPALWLALQIPLVAFLMADRYRLATWPVIALLAAVGLQAAVELARSWSAGARPERAVWIALAAAALPWLPIDPVTAFNPGWCRHVEGNLAYGDKDYAAAAALYEEALTHDPDDVDARRWLAYAKNELGHPDEAVKELAQVIEVFPDHYPTLMFMSQLEQKLGDLPAAAKYAGMAYQVPGERTNTGVRYVELLVRAGDRDRARQVMADDDKLLRHPKLIKLFGSAPGSDEPLGSPPLPGNASGHEDEDE